MKGIGMAVLTRVLVIAACEKFIAKDDTRRAAQREKYIIELMTKRRWFKPPYTRQEAQIIADADDDFRLMNHMTNIGPRNDVVSLMVLAQASRDDTVLVGAETFSHIHPYYKT